MKLLIGDIMIYTSVDGGIGIYRNIPKYIPKQVKA